MKKKFLVLIVLCLVVGLIFLAGREYYYRNQHYFISPLPPGMELVIRNDSYGRGAFGARRNGGRRHNGVDLAAGVGIPVYAVRSGRVVKAGYKGANGNYIKLKHRGGLVTYYLHLSAIYTRQGKRVRQGEMIGRIGKTGNADHEGIEPHLHFEIREDNKPVDPFLNYLERDNL